MKAYRVVRRDGGNITRRMCLFGGHWQWRTRKEAEIAAAELMRMCNSDLPSFYAEEVELGEMWQSIDGGAWEPVSPGGEYFGWLITRDEKERMMYDILFAEDVTYKKLLPDGGYEVKYDDGKIFKYEWRAR